MPTLLKPTAITRVGFVDKGANPEAHIVFWKRGEEPPNALKKEENVDRDSTIKRALEMLTKALGINPGGDMPDDSKAELDLEAIPEEQREAVRALEKRAVEAEEKAEGLAARAADLEKAAETGDGDGGEGDGASPPSEEEVVKGLTPEARKLYEAQQEEIAKLRESQEETAKVAQEERQRRRVAEFTKRAEEDFSHVQGTAAEKAELLMALQDNLDEETFEKVEETLAAANEQIRQSRLFRVVGRDGDGTGTGSAYAKLKAKAEEIRKADPKLSEARSLLEARNAHPELAREYEREVREA